MRLSKLFAASLVSLAVTTSALDAQTPPPNVQSSKPIIPFEAISPKAPDGDKLDGARRIAAIVVAQQSPSPKHVVDVGSYTGEFLEAFLTQFPQAKGQWTEPVDNNRANAGRRLEKFGQRVNYRIGCAARDLSLGCVPQGTDTLISSWLTIHQNLEGIQKFHREAFAILPSGGMIAIIDRVGGAPEWVKQMTDARASAVVQGAVAPWEGPPVHHPDFKTPTQRQQLEAMRTAGFADVQVVWRRLDTIVMIARKP